MTIKLQKNPERKKILFHFGPLGDSITCKCWGLFEIIVSKTSWLLIFNFFKSIHKYSRDCCTFLISA